MVESKKCNNLNKNIAADRKFCKLHDKEKFKNMNTLKVE